MLNPKEKYHTVGTGAKSKRKIPLSKQVLNPKEKYHIVVTVPKSKRKIPHCRNRC
jgi:hypothetical protein